MQSSPMVQLEIARLVCDHARERYTLLLRERDGERVLELPLGILEVSVCDLRLSGAAPGAGDPYQLMYALLQATAAEPWSVELVRHPVHRARGRIVIAAGGGKEGMVEARAIDAVLLALAAERPLWAEAALLGSPPPVVDNP